MRGALGLCVVAVGSRNHHIGQNGLRENHHRGQVLRGGLSLLDRGEDGSEAAEQLRRTVRTDALLWHQCVGGLVTVADALDGVQEPSDLADTLLRLVNRLAVASARDRHKRPGSGYVVHNCLKLSQMVVELLVTRVKKERRW